MRYLIDTSIWIDLFENRKGFRNEQLGDYALRLFSKILKEGSKIIKTELLIHELRSKYSIQQINGMLAPFEKITEFIPITSKQDSESEKLIRDRIIPKGDALYAILARDHNLILVTRDKHFRLLKDISEHHKPEELI